MGFDEVEREPTEGERYEARSKRVGGRSIGLVREGGYISQSGALCRASGVDVNSLPLSLSRNPASSFYFSLVPASIPLFNHINLTLPLSAYLCTPLSFSSPFYLHPARR